MLKLLILADDFTGALDTSVQFSKFGAKTRVTTETNLNSSILMEDIDVLAIDTESRYLSHEASYELITQLSQTAKNLGIPYLYKKIDSALRGNISSEIKAIRDVYEQEGLAIVPAFPSVNRVVRQGVLYIDNQPVSESIFGTDSYEPVFESNIIKRLKNEVNLEVDLITDTKSNLTQGKVYLFDAATEQDMINIGNQLEGKKLLTATVGCAGFATILASHLFGKESQSNVELNFPLTVICGSVNPITQAQVFHAKEQGAEVFSLHGHQLLENDYWMSKKGQNDLENFMSSFQFSDCVIFESFGPDSLSSVADYIKSTGGTLEEIRLKIGAAFGKLVQALVQRGVERTFLFTGGDTLYQSMQVLGITCLIPIGEVSPGVVLSVIKWQDKAIQVLTKSGGFGHQALFEDIVKVIKKRRNYVS